MDLSADVSSYYKGVARVSLQSLYFESVLGTRAHREHCEKNVKRLKEIFSIENGCNRYDEENYISATVDERSLLRSLQSSGYGEDSIRAPPSSEIPYLENIHLNCLHGLHRILAAKEVLDEDDQWWTVKLFSSVIRVDLPVGAAIHKIEKYENERPFSDGEIFRSIRLYARSGDTDKENKWWARLSTSKRKDVRQLLKNPRFTSAFDKLVDKRGLWTSLHLGTLHRFLTLRCEEELVHYLEHISSTWDIVLGESISSDVVDTSTVESLELLAPRLSHSDREKVISLMANREIFTSVHEESARQRLLSNILSLPLMIPSLHTFFENLKYIEPCCKILRILIGPKQTRSIRQELSKSWSHPADLVLETGEGYNRIFQSVAQPQSFNLAYKSLWLYTLRHFFDMTDSIPRKERQRNKPVAKSPNLAYWHGIGHLAVRLGFRTRKIIELNRMQPYEAIATNFLKCHGYQTSSEEHVQVISDILFSLAMPVRMNENFEFVHRLSELSHEQRCGRPFESSHIRDKNSLFLSFLYTDINQTGLDITTLLVKRDMFLSFFGQDDFDFFGANSIESEPTLHRTANHVTGQSGNSMRQIQELEAECLALNEQNTALSEIINSRNRDIQEANATYERQIMDIRRQYSQEQQTMESRNLDLEEQIKSLDAAVKLKDNVIQRQIAMEQVRESNNDAERMKNDNQTLNLDNENIKAKLNDHQNEIDVLSKTLREKEEQLRAAQQCIDGYSLRILEAEQIGTNKNDAERMKNDNQALKLDNKNIKAKLNDYQNETDVLSKALREKEEQLRAAQHYNEGQSRRILEAEQISEKQAQDLIQSRQSLENITQKMNDTLYNFENQSRETIKVRQDLDNRAHQIVVARQDIENQTQEISQAKGTIENQAQEIVQAQKIIEDQRQEILYAKQSLEEKSGTLEAHQNLLLEGERELIETHKQQQEEANQIINHQLQDLEEKRRLETLAKEYADQKNLLEETRKEAESYKSRINEQEENLSQVSKKNREYEDIMMEGSQKLSELTSHKQRIENVKTNNLDDFLKNIKQDISDATDTVKLIWVENSNAEQYDFRIVTYYVESLDRIFPEVVQQIKVFHIRKKQRIAIFEASGLAIVGINEQVVINTWKVSKALFISSSEDAMPIKKSLTFTKEKRKLYRVKKRKIKKQIKN